MYTYLNTNCRRINVDISFGNNLGVLKSKYIKFYTDLDIRFKQLVLLVKDWAKQRKINDSNNHGLNSFVYTLMTLFYMQHIKLLPKLEINGTQDEYEYLCSLTRIPETITPEDNIFPTYNFDISHKLVAPDKSIAELLKGFFDFYANKFKFETKCISTRMGFAIPKETTYFASTKTPQAFCVEDPFMLTENTARTIGMNSIVSIKGEIKRAHILLKENNLETLYTSLKLKRNKELAKYNIA